MSYVNENIKVLRNRMGLTQEKLAALLGINRKAVGSYEENRATPPLDKLNRLASLFGVSMDQLIHHRFSTESPLFEEQTPEAPTEVVKEAPALIVEKKKPFSRTGWIDEAIPYISYKYFDKYILDEDFPQRLDDMPVFRFPFMEKGKSYRAFDTPEDSNLQEGIIIGEECDLSSFKSSDDPVLVITQDKGILLGRVQQDSVWKISLTDGRNLISTNVKEIWKPVGFFSKGLPKAVPDMKGIAQSINALKMQMDSLL